MKVEKMASGLTNDLLRSEFGMKLREARLDEVMLDAYYADRKRILNDKLQELEKSNRSQSKK